ncbi:MAG: PorT family protein [Cytophagaceae bacterium]|nr:PorT family protein [Cytophagaceae bacterium]
MRILLFTFGTLLLCNSLCGQSPGLALGGHFGIGQAKISKANINNQTGRLALQGGLSLNYQFVKNFGLYGNILFSGKGSRASGNDVQSTFFGNKEFPFEQKYNLYYIEIPVMAKLSLGINNFYFKAFAGPSINFNVKGTESKIYEDKDYHEQNGYSDREIQGLNLMEYSFCYGGGIDVEIAQQSIFFLEVRNNIGMNTFGKINNLDAFNQYFGLGLGILYKY